MIEDYLKMNLASLWNLVLASHLQIKIGPLIAMITNLIKLWYLEKNYSLCLNMTKGKINGRLEKYFSLR